MGNHTKKKLKQIVQLTKQNLQDEEAQGYHKAIDSIIEEMESKNLQNQKIGQKFHRKFNKASK